MKNLQKFSNFTEVFTFFLIFEQFLLIISFFYWSSQVEVYFINLNSQKLFLKILFVI